MYFQHISAPDTALIAVIELKGSVEQFDFDVMLVIDESRE
jgi:hypothetical protein